MADKSDKSEGQTLTDKRESEGKEEIPDSSIKASATELIGVEERSKIKEALQSPGPAEIVDNENSNPELSLFRQQYERISNEAKGRCSWKAVVERLLANDSEKLKFVQSMQGGGELVGVDQDGKALFKDKGVEPVMYGFVDWGRLIKIYDRNPEQMKQVRKWANYFEIREQVLKDGYELFNRSRHGNFFVTDISDEMIQVMNHTKEPFVACKDGKGVRYSWLESGDDPDQADYAKYSSNKDETYCYCCRANANRYLLQVHVCYERYPEHAHDESTGAIRLLRV